MSGASAIVSRGYADEETIARDRAARHATDEAMDGRRALPLPDPGCALFPLHRHALSFGARTIVAAAGAARGGAGLRHGCDSRQPRPLARPGLAGELAEHARHARRARPDPRPNGH